MIPYTTIPFLSAMFLVLVGVLLGNLVWSRSRDRHAVLSEQWRDRAKRIASNLDDRTTQLQQMEELWGEVLQESDELRSRLNAMEATAERLQRERDEFAAQCEQERETRVNLAASLHDETRQSAEWKERAAAALQTETAAREAASHVEHLQATIESVQSTNETLLAQISQLKEELARVRGPEREADKARAEQREAALREQLRQAQADAEALRERMVELEPRLEHSEEQLRKARGPEQEALVAQARECEQNLRADLDRARRTAEELMDRLEERDATLAREAASRKQAEEKLTRRCQDLRESMLREIHRINGDRRQLEQRVAEETTLQANLVRQRQQLAECQQRSAEELERLAARLEQEEEKARELMLQLRAESSARKQLQESQQILSRREQVLLDEIVPLRAVAEESKRLRRELAALQTQHDQLAATRAEELERAEELHNQRLHLEEDLAVARSEMLTWQKKCKQLQADSEAGRGTLESVRNELQDRESILQRLRDAFRKSQAELSTTTVRFASLESAAQQDRERHAVVEREAETLRAHVADVRSQMATLAEQLAARGVVESQLQSGWDAARAEVARLAPFEDRLVEGEAIIKSLREEVRDLKRHRDDAQQAVASMQEVVAELRDELAERLDSFEISESDRATIQREFQLERQRREQLAEACSQWEHDCQLAQQQLADLQDQKARLRGQLDEWQGRAQQSAQQATALEQQVMDLQSRLRGQLDEWQGRAQQSTEQAAMLEQQVMDLQMRLEQQEEMTRQLRGRRLAERPATVAEPRSGLSFLGLRAKERSQKDLEEMALRRDERLGRVYVEPPRRTDDLTRIPGVSRDLQTQLQQLGIYTFQQVMEWDASIVQEVSSRLGLRGEVEQDDWVGNARRLYHERQRLVA